LDYFEQRKIILDDRNINDWQVIKIKEAGLKKNASTEICINGIHDLAKGDIFIIQNGDGESPIPNIDFNTTCFIAEGNPYLSLHLPEGTYQLKAVTEVRRMTWGGKLL